MKNLAKNNARKWWRRGMRFDVPQWESRLHPDFLFVTVYGNDFVSRIGNWHFNLVGEKPQLIYRGISTADAIAFALKWIRKNSGRDYCERAHERAAEVSMRAAKRRCKDAKLPPDATDPAIVLREVEAA